MGVRPERGGVEVCRTVEVGTVEIGLSGEIDVSGESGLREIGVAHEVRSTEGRGAGESGLDEDGVGEELRGTELGAVFEDGGVKIGGSRKTKIVEVGKFFEYMPGENLHSHFGASHGSRRSRCFSILQSIRRRLCRARFSRIILRAQRFQGVRA